MGPCTRIPIHIYIYTYIRIRVRVYETGKGKESGKAKRRKRKRQRVGVGRRKTCTNVETETRRLTAHKRVQASFVIPAFSLACFIVHTSFLPTCAPYYIANISRHDSMSTATRLYVERAARSW